MKRLLKRAGAKGARWRLPRRLALVIAIALLCAPLAVFGGHAIASATSHATPTHHAGPSHHLAAPPPKSVPLAATSTGCGKAPPASPGTSVEEQLRVDNVPRSYLLHVPLGYQPTHPTPLMLSFHGHGSTAFIQQRMTGFSVLADRDGFLAVYPQGTIGKDKATGWATGPLTYPQVDDVAFVRDLLAHLRATLCVDPHRIDASGFSNGGGMTALLACKLPGQIAAFATVSGSYFPVDGGCSPGRAVPILEIHGTADRTVSYVGNPTRLLPPVPIWLAQWAARDGCLSQPQVFLNSSNVVGKQWQGCASGAAVVHYEIIGGRHVWPTTLPGSESNRHLSTAALIWAFCQAHPLA
jgi:polyhydroxybutyrate depolymerase